MTGPRDGNQKDDAGEEDLVGELRAYRDRIGRTACAAATATAAMSFAAATPTIAAATGATAIPILTPALGLFGITVVGATPIGWVLASAVVGGSLCYALCRTVNSGGRAEGRHQERHRQAAQTWRDSQARHRRAALDEQRLRELKSALVKAQVDDDLLRRTLAAVGSGRLSIDEALGSFG